GLLCTRTAARRPSAIRRETAVLVAVLEARLPVLLLRSRHVLHGPSCYGPPLQKKLPRSRYAVDDLPQAPVLEMVTSSGQAPLASTSGRFPRRGEGPCQGNCAGLPRRCTRLL